MWLFLPLRIFHLATLEVTGIWQLATWHCAHFKNARRQTQLLLLNRQINPNFKSKWLKDPDLPSP